MSVAYFWSKSTGFYAENINTCRLLDMIWTFTYTTLDKRASDRVHSKDSHCLWQTVASNKLCFMEQEWMVSDLTPDMFMSSLAVSLCISPSDCQCSFYVEVFNGFNSELLTLTIWGIVFFWDPIQMQFLIIFLEIIKVISFGITKITF